MSRTPVFSSPRAARQLLRLQLADLGGEVWSRRITEKDRLVYDIQSDVITIIACSFHYDDH